VSLRMQRGFKLLTALFLACSLVGSAATSDLPGTLQAAADQALSGQAGTAVVLDVASGKLLARHRLEVAARRLAAPGSAIKPFTLLALLSSGRFDPNQRLLCPRNLVIAGRRLNCSHPDVPSGFDASEALAYSCNFYFATFASQLKEEDLRREFQRTGLLSSTGLASDEAVGSMRRAANDNQLKLLAL
jgi:cell division protein FtsI/penicillin-binding protein 2